MNLSKYIQKWKDKMAKLISKKDGKSWNEIQVTLIPHPVPKEEFQKIKQEVSEIIASMIIAATKRGRPTSNDEDMKNAA